MSTEFDVLQTVTESPVEIDGHTYVSRRNAGEDRWQVFRDSEIPPVGFFELHECGKACSVPKKHGVPNYRLRTYDATNRVYGSCVTNYRKVLENLRMRYLNP